jgi:hypothetical protein
MAVVGFTTKTYDQGKKGQGILVEWTGVNEGDTCTRFIAPALSDGCFSVDGTFGGASVALHGSNAQTDANFTALKDIFDNAIAITTAGKEQVAENPLAYKPVITGGAGTTITIRLLLYGRN